ncbi:ABC transporter permease [Roseovarius sp. SCSIO 43702]|uniref:ABC transporter permease n=1 Tax=Roseovarius sp. SCSIO 43702 TaxID=2823043 RepID=UPI001C737467|nr:ABC transporter permease [Roseovarius sp. SCSIO 43702]QYX56871.1 ABC transporter permease [Roseovarius sp. SCSIO 43702]
MRRFAATRATSALVLREMGSSFGRTPGGYIWAILEPVAAVALLAGIFTLAFDKPPLGRDFALFYASGYLPFMLYSDLAQKVGVALRYSRPLMAYPAVSWWDALAARFILNTLTHLVVVVLFLAALFAWSGIPVNLRLPSLAAALGLAAFLGAGVGCLNAYLFEAFPVWERAWAILNRPLFILSGVLFLPDAVPPPFDDLFWLNPLVHVVTEMRVGLYAGYGPAEVSSLYVLGIGGVAMAFGLMLLRRSAHDFLATP